MKISRRLASKAMVEDITAPAAVRRFREVASSFTAKASSSKKAALNALKREGILTAKGHLTKHYAGK